MTRYAVTRYDTGEVIGHVELNAEQFSRYEELSQQPQGIVRLGALPHDLYALDDEFQDTHEDTVVFLA